MFGSNQDSKMDLLNPTTPLENDTFGPKRVNDPLGVDLKMNSDYKDYSVSNPTPYEATSDLLASN